MKKKWMVAGLATVMVLSMTACGGKDEIEQESVATIESQTKEATSEVTVETGTTEEKEEISFWILQQDFATPQKESEITLFNEAAVLPLDLGAIDEYAAPYYCYISEEIYLSDSLEELLAEESAGGNEIDSGSFRSIYVQRPNGEATEYYDENYCGFSSIEIYNKAEEGKLSLKTCFENGWWQISAVSYAQMLQIDVNGLKKEEVCDRIIEKFGSPTYIAPELAAYESLDAYFATLEPDSVTIYSLIYEYPGYTIRIMITEDSFGPYPVPKVSDVYYYPEEMWKIVKTEHGLESRCISVN